MKAFKYIFTSPSSVLKMGAGHERTVQPKKRCKLDECRTRSPVTTILGMKCVSPRAIAYITVQVHYVLLHETITHSSISFAFHYQAVVVGGSWMVTSVTMTFTTTLSRSSSMLKCLKTGNLYKTYSSGGTGSVLFT